MSTSRRQIRVRLRRGAIGALALSLGLITAGLAAEVLAAPDDALPLGQAGLKETRTSRVMGPGVKLTRITRGDVKAASEAMVASTQTGPWRVRLLTVDPRRATGHLRATYGADLGRTETVTSLARFEGAVAGTNASFFSIGSQTASRGNPVGMAVHGGVVQSEPTRYGPETHFLLDAAANTARVLKLRWRGALTHAASDTLVAVDHVNEAPKAPAGCGVRRLATACDLPGEVSVFTDEWGTTTPAGAGVELVLDSAGCLLRTAMSRGLTLRPGQISVQATGQDVPPLLELLALGCVQRTDIVTDPTGAAVPMTPSTFVVNGRYQLLRGGKVVAPAGSTGFLGRNPRTIAGTTSDGKLALITIDGRSRTSAGVTMREAAEVAKSLGLVEALNLDGGGSTVMSIAGHASNKPSDGAERSVGDALVYVPAPWRPES